MSSLLSFPSPVNEVAARIVAGCVAVLALVALVLELRWLVVVLAVGFVLRVASGPRLDPLAAFVVRVVVPRLPVAPRPVAGPPKRFAQGIGAVMTVAASVCLFAGAATVGWILVGALACFAALESVLGLCAGCQVFGLLMRAGVISEETCAECADLGLRWAGNEGAR